MPSDIFFIIDFSIIIFILIINLILSFIIILIVIKTRTLRTINNLLQCNTCIAIIFYSIVNIIASLLGFREDWTLNTPLCSFRAFFFNVSVAAICYSKLIHTISHLFFAVLYKYRYLLRWRIHYILIIFNWIVSLIVSIPPFFIKGGYGFERESRSCVISTKIFSAALHTSITSYIIPLIIIGIIHMKILYYVHQSTRRIGCLVSTGRHTVTNANTIIKKNKREIKLMRQMFRQTSTLVFGGLTYLFLIIWHVSREQILPESIYLLGFNFLTISIILANIIQFIMNTKVKQIILQKFCRHRPSIVRLRHIHRQQAWHIT